MCRGRWFWQEAEPKWDEGDWSSKRQKPLTRWFYSRGGKPVGVSASGCWRVWWGRTGALLSLEYNQTLHHSLLMLHQLLSSNTIPVKSARLFDIVSTYWMHLAEGCPASRPSVSQIIWILYVTLLFKGSREHSCLTQPLWKRRLHANEAVLPIH